MSKSSTRMVTIYINGKEVEASVKQIQAEMNKHSYSIHDYMPNSIYAQNL